MDLKKKNQLQAIIWYLKDKEATSTEISVALGIYRPSMCRYKRKLEKAGYLMESGWRKCSITKRWARALILSF